MTKPNHKMPLRIIPLGGLGEIGLNCMAFDYDDEIIVVDCGVMFSDLQMLGVDFVIPDMTYLRDNKERISGYLVTHAHEDHIGALPFALKNHPAPVYCSPFAQKLIEARLEEYDLLGRVDFHPLSDGQTVGFKHFQVTPHDVNHSVVEALALFIDSPVGKIIFTGDFKIDANPYYGKELDPKPFEEAGREGVLLLMSDSTNVEQSGHSLSEKRIYATFEKLLSNTMGMTVIAVFASNIARIGQVFEIAKRFKKKVAPLGRSMEQNIRLAHASGYLEDMNDVLIAADDIDQYDRKSVIVISTGSQGEYRSALVRIANDEQRNIKLREGDLVVLSSKFIPGNEKAIGRMINQLFMLGADVLYESVSDIHVSGHANQDELKAMLKMTKPKFFVPVHGEYRHLVKHKKLALATNIKEGHALLAINGDVLELEPDRLEMVDHFEENRIFIENEGGKDVSKVIIKDRRKVAETGIVFSVLIRDSSSGQIIADPDITSRGLLEEGQASQGLIEGAKRVVQEIIDEVETRGKQKQADLQEEVRVGLRRYFNSRLGKKPVVLPIVIDL